MPERLKNLLIKLLFKLLDVGSGPSDEEDKEVTRWLAHSAQDVGFIRYIQSRERKIVRELTVDGLLPVPRDSFVRKSGQRFELHAFHTKALAAYQKSIKK